MMKGVNNSKYCVNIYNKNYFSGKNSFFYKFGYKDSPLIWKSRFDILLRYKNKGRLLDVGCALGFMLSHYSRYFKVYGIDCSKYAINTAKKNVKKGIFRVHNAERSFPFKNNFFDVVTCFDVIEHLEHTDSLIENIYNVLKHGGIFVLITPNYNTLRKLIFHFPDKMEHHISLYHVDDIIEKLEKNNFEVLESFTGLNLLSRSYWFKNRLGPESMVISKK
jgi:2-polyprenyl-3-methyl-5-hydroxy-6-metoxy-1,4-benzoquinol methylase